VGLDELARRDEENLAKRKMLFRGIECDKSCYLFSKVILLFSMIFSRIGSAFFVTGLCIMENLKLSS